MIRTFARCVSSSGDASGRSNEQPIEEDGVISHVLRPMHMSEQGQASVSEESRETNLEEETADFNDGTTGLILQGEREVRIKLFIGQVFMGWFWLIPAFHMTYPQDTPTPPSFNRLVLTRKEIDFALGAGSSIIDVTLEWTTVPNTGQAVKL